MKRKKLWLILLILLLCFIWGNSMMLAPVSTDISEWFRSIFNGLAGFLGSGEAASSGRIRKTAHFVEFAVLGIVASLLILSGRKRKKEKNDAAENSGKKATIRAAAGVRESVTEERRRRYGISVFLTALFGLIVACADEMIQLTSSGRSAQLSDVALDFCGYLTGMAAAFVFRIIRKRRGNHKRKEESAG